MKTDWTTAQSETYPNGGLFVNWGVCCLVAGLGLKRRSCAVAASVASGWRGKISTAAAQSGEGHRVRLRTPKMLSVTHVRQGAFLTVGGRTGQKKFN